ncbi:hypothetical protein FRC00_007682 [Tulasnella sp. 408]|nr:hypothetical protein FRC00_007682 [Tulasnella sp. 408]
MLEIVQGRIPYDAEDLERELPQLSQLLVTCWDQQPSQRPAAVDCLGAIQSVLHSSGPGNIAQQISRQSPPEQLPAFANNTVKEQKPSPLRTPFPPQVPSTRLQESSHAIQPLQSGLPGRPTPFRDFFTTEYTTWLADQQVTLDPLRIDGKEVLLYKLFLMVSEKNLWPQVGAKLGFPHFSEPIPHSKPEVAEQLLKIYEEVLASFEVFWNNSLRPLDPISIFPLPTQLQYLHPEVERLATAQFPPQQTQLLRGIEPSQSLDGNAGRTAPNQLSQPAPKTSLTQREEETIEPNEPQMPSSSPHSALGEVEARGRSPPQGGTSQMTLWTPMYPTHPLPPPASNTLLSKRVREDDGLGPNGSRPSASYKRARRAELAPELTTAAESPSESMLNLLEKAVDNRLTTGYMGEETE